MAAVLSFIPVRFSCAAVRVQAWTGDVRLPKRSDLCSSVANKMKRLLLTLLSMGLTAFTVHAENLTLVGGTAINPADGKIIQNAVITISGDTIQRVGSGDKAPAGAKTIDCKGKFILPG